MKTPQTNAEWQTVVDASEAALQMVASGEARFLPGEVDVERCRNLIAIAPQGIRPNQFNVTKMIHESLGIGKN